MPHGGSNGKSQSSPPIPLSLVSNTGGFAQRPSAHAWKACVGQPTEGSNPSSSAIFSQESFLKTPNLVPMAHLANEHPGCGHTCDFQFFHEPGLNSCLYFQVIKLQSQASVEQKHVLQTLAKDAVQLEYQLKKRFVPGFGLVIVLIQVRSCALHHCANMCEYRNSKLNFNANIFCL